MGIDKLSEYTREMIAGIVGYFIFLAGGLDQALEFLIVCIFLDYLTGLAKAMYCCDITSKKSIIGIIKKLGILTLVLVANMIDVRMGLAGKLRNYFIYMLFINECLSITENLGVLRVPGAKKLCDLIEIAKKYLKK